MVARARHLPQIIRKFSKILGFSLYNRGPRCIARPIPAPHTGPVLLDYAGATLRTDPDAARSLPSRRWAYQPKVDGCYVRLTLDGAGRISSVLSRSGRPVACDLAGIVAGPPDTVLHGELEAHTEAGIAAAARRGWAAVYLFDVSRLAGADTSARPYAERHGLLYTAQSMVECAGQARVRSWRTDAQGDAHNAAGRYTAATPRDLRRLPVVPLHRGPDGFDELWSSHVGAGGEGLVAVRLDARLGARGSKRKIKLTDTLDAVVLAADAAAIRVAARVPTDSARGPSHRVVEFCLPGRAVPGSVVEVALDGWYATGLPRFPRIVRSRADLGGAPMMQ